MDLKKTFGENIQRARRMRKLSLSELAARIGTSVAKVKSFECGDEIPDMEFISKIANATGVELRFFFETGLDEGQKILLRRNAMPKREKAAVIELARYKSGGIVSLAVVCGLTLFKPIPKRDVSLADALKIGEDTAKAWFQKGRTLSEILESKGIFVTRIPAETGLFRGLFIYRRGVPVIAMPTAKREEKEEVETISHEIGHAVFLRQGFSENTEETLCDAFCKGFSSIISEPEFSIGEFDFAERTAVSAWRQGKITASRAAEILEIKTADFLEKNKNEDIL